MNYYKHQSHHDVPIHLSMNFDATQVQTHYENAGAVPAFEIGMPAKEDPPIKILIRKWSLQKQKQTNKPIE